MALMGFREYARHRQVTLRAVQKAIEAKRIKPTPEKKIDSEQADRDWITNTDPAKQSLLYPAGSAPPNPAPPPSEDAEPEGEAKGASDEHTVAYREHRAERERINAERAQLDLDRERGRLVDKDEVALLRFTEFRALRDALGNIGARIKDACAAQTDALTIEQLIDGEIATVLSAFADNVLTRGVLQDDDSEDDDAAD